MQNARFKGKSKGQLQDFFCSCWMEDIRRDKSVEIFLIGGYHWRILCYKHIKYPPAQTWGVVYFSGVAGEPEMNIPAERDAVVYDVTPTYKIERDRQTDRQIETETDKARLIVSVVESGALLQTRIGLQAPTLGQEISMSPWREHTTGFILGSKRGPLKCPTKEKNRLSIKQETSVCRHHPSVSILPLQTLLRVEGQPTAYTLQGPDRNSSLELD